MGRQKAAPTPPPPPPPSPTPTRVDTAGQQRMAEVGERRRMGRASTILTKRKPKVQKLGGSTKASTSILGQKR